MQRLPLSHLLHVSSHRVPAGDRRDPPPPPPPNLTGQGAAFLKPWGGSRSLVAQNQLLLESGILLPSEPSAFWGPIKMSRLLEPLGAWRGAGWVEVEEEQEHQEQQEEEEQLGSAAPSPDTVAPLSAPRNEPDG